MPETASSGEIPLRPRSSISNFFSKKLGRKKKEDRLNDEKKFWEEVKQEMERCIERELRIRTLEDLYLAVKSLPDDTLTRDCLQNHDIKLEELDLFDYPKATNINTKDRTKSPESPGSPGSPGSKDSTDSPSFFEPASKSDLKKYEFSDDDETQSELWSYTRVSKSYSVDGSLGTADPLCHDLAWRFSANRVSKQGDGQNIRWEKEPTLAESHRWNRRLGFNRGMLNEMFYATLFLSSEQPLFRPVHAWEFEEKHEKPHLMFTFQHSTVDDGENIRRGELLAILATMQSRMAWDFARDHLIVPIMVFSFMASYGRIIQAYHDGKSLIIRMSDQVNFADRESFLDNMDLFICYLANKPQGDTQQLNRHFARSEEEVASVLRDHPPPSYEQIIASRAGSIRKARLLYGPGSRDRRALYEGLFEQLSAENTSLRSTSGDEESQ